MKIYNKKNFRYGLGMTTLGVLMLLTSIWKGFDVKGTVILALCLFVGIGLMLRSLSRDMSREDKIAELDERNRMVEWRAKSRALGIAELICVVCILVSIVGMRIVKDFFGGMLVAFGLMYTIMLLTELFTLLYYDKKL
ncbi:MAG TPA: DUF2178 domain-containing protein [Candidatus Agathobaculum intestinigallinarum]|nr:DUF2178 domain-containing protein [Candidatus Agathobaculum intestinigallinarum]